MPSIRCFFCSRSLKEPVLFFNGQPIGPTCYKRHNLGSGATAKKVTRHPIAPKPRPERDDRTLDLFGDDDD